MCGFAHDRTLEEVLCMNAMYGFALDKELAEDLCVNVKCLCSIVCSLCMNISNEATLNHKLYGTKEVLQTTVEFITRTNLGILSTFPERMKQHV